MADNRPAIAVSITAFAICATIHSDRNRSERLWGVGGRSTAPAAYTSVCEEREYRPTPPQSRAVDLCRYV